MYKKYFFLFIITLFVFFNQKCISQTLIAAYNFPPTTVYNGFWGITQINDTLWIGSSSNGKLYKITKTGIIIDSLATVFNFNNGLAFDGTGFWIARNAAPSNPRIVKVNFSGNPLDSIRINSLYGNVTIGIGGIALDGNSLWAAIYYPDFPNYPFAYAYKIDLTSKLIVDSIPLRGKQVQGIAVKGDTIFYVNDNFQSEPERIYAYRKSVGDTIFSFPAPDPDNDCDPRGLYWDGNHLWLIAYRVGNNIGQFRTLYKYQIGGQGSPIITTSANSFNFGNVIIGSSGTRTLTINNVGSGNLILTAFNFTNPRFSINPNSVPDTIPPSSSKNYTLSFTPNSPDSVTGELRISNNDLGNPLVTISLAGRGIYSGPFISSSHTSLNYPNRRLNCLSGGTFTITNQGNQQLSINSITFSSQRFRLDTTNVQFPILLDTQATRTLRIWFNPNAVSSFSDSAVFSTNAVNQLTIQLTGSAQNNPSALGDIMWESNIPPNPRTTLQDYQPKSMKMIPDVNNDGINDLIVCTGNYWTICYNGNASVNADTLWKFNTHFGSINTGSVDWEDAMQIINDINGDGISDVIIGCAGGNEMVYALSGSNGRKLWEYGNPNTTSDGDVMGIRTDKDYNNDGRNDVLISVSGETNFSGRHAVICVNSLNGQVIFNVTQPYNFTYDVESMPGGGAIGAGNNGGPYFLRGFDNSGINTWNYTLTSAAWSVKRIPDINNDSYPDLVGLQGFAGNVYAVSGNSGSQIWSQSLGSSNNGTIQLTDDKDNDGFNDLILSGPQSGYRLDSKTGQILWSQPFGASYLRDCDTLGDITQDGIKEVLFSTQQPGKVFVLNGSTGAILFEFLFGNSIQERADRVSSIKSIDGNLSNEFVACSRDGRIKCFSGGPVNPIGISGNNSNIPKYFALYQNYPNPFNPETNISFDLPIQTQVKIAVYDILGREVVTLLNSDMKPGKYNLSWNASEYASGVYFYKLISSEYTQIRKMMFIK